MDLKKQSTKEQTSFIKGLFYVMIFLGILLGPWIWDLHLDNKYRNIQANSPLLEAVVTDKIVRHNPWYEADFCDVFVEFTYEGKTLQLELSHFTDTWDCDDYFIREGFSTKIYYLPTKHKAYLEGWVDDVAK